MHILVSLVGRLFVCFREDGEKKKNLDANPVGSLELKHREGGLLGGKSYTRQTTCVRKNAALLEAPR